ncbi:MAG TPA: cellulose synthase [Streptosporangiaceae bacterium]
MSTYSQIAWLPLTGGLTLIGLVASWFAWRRRGIAAGLRGVAWSLLPIAAYLTGVIELLWRFGTAITSFATSFVFSPKVWSGVIVAIVAVVLFVVSGQLRGRARKRSGGAAEPSAGTVAKPAKAIGPAKAKAASLDDDEFGDVADILRKHGIR